MRNRIGICIVEPAEIVALDIQETLAASDQPVQYATFATVSEAQNFYEGTTAPDLVIVSGSSANVFDSREENLGWLAARKVIALDYSGNEGPNWRSIEKPFDPAQLLRLAQDLLCESGGRQSA